MYKYIIKYDFLRYGIVGVLTVILDFILLFIFFSYLNIEQNSSITLSYTLASIFNFFMHKYFTFKSRNKVDREIVKFILLVLFSYFITIITVNYIMAFEINLYFAKIISLFFIYVIIYFINKFFVYKNNENERKIF